MLQVAIAVCAALVLVGLLTHTDDKGNITTMRAEPAGPSIYKVARDGGEATLPSSAAAPKSSFGTPIIGASKMPAASSYTHTMYDD